MMYLIIVAVVVVVILVIRALYKSHIKWIQNQTPGGVWVYEDSLEKITLQFNREPEDNLQQGSYYKLIEKDGEARSVNNRWFTRIMDLRTLPMASEDKENEPVGQEIQHTIAYTGPAEITVTTNGVDKKYQKAPEGMELEFEKQEQNALITQKPETSDDTKIR
ncbi:MAG: hypothetical protein GY854_20130 [Deltaproteobacteria bacterium]|nr:hypothetical protein [Deltaproteobacteria bacterium]